METTLLNDQMYITAPEGFYQMSEEEIRELNYSGEPPKWCVKNPEKHIIFSISWRKTNALFSALLSERDVARNMEKALKGAMQQPFDYKLEEFASSSLSGKTAEGFSYNYVVDGVGMHGIIYSVKAKNTFYYIYGYIRQENRSESEPIVEEILNSISWKQK